VRLGIPLYACDPALLHLGTRSGSRSVFREAGVAMPEGAANLRDMRDAVAALAALKGRQPTLKRAVIKLEQGASGEGNCIFDYSGAPTRAGLESWIASQLAHRLQPEAAVLGGATGQRYLDADSGLFFTAQGEARYYYATDNLVKTSYRRLTPPDLIDVAIEHNLHFDRATQQGVTFNLIGAVSEFGKLGIVSIARSPAEAELLYHRTVRALDAACT
jgi:PGM1 C-terminal domain